MVSKKDRKVIANALEVYIQTLRGMSVETAMKCRPYSAQPDEEEIASSASCDDEICEQGRE